MGLADNYYARKTTRVAGALWDRVGASQGCPGAMPNAVAGPWPTAKRPNALPGSTAPPRSPTFSFSSPSK